MMMMMNVFLKIDREVEPSYKEGLSLFPSSLESLTEKLRFPYKAWRWSKKQQSSNDSLLDSMLDTMGQIKFHTSKLCLPW